MFLTLLLQVEDLQNWKPVLTKLVQIMDVYGKRLPNYEFAEVMVASAKDIVIVTKALHFLTKLIKVAKEKRHFFAFKVTPPLWPRFC